MSGKGAHSEGEVLTKADFITDQVVRWCPGCGDYSILAQVQKVLPTLGIPKEKIVFISGIGCSSRFPYYVNTYGFHTIHGRAPAVATGLKVANPELCVWVVTGDGDGLSIGGNHLIHVMRRNLDINILLFNNGVYGLTKGQYSPTSEFGKVTKSSPAGTIESPVNPTSIAIAAEASFVARTADVDPRHLAWTLEQAAAHKGTSFVEILQNCIIFNDKTHDPFLARSVRHDRVLYLEEGKPMLFGSEHPRGIATEGFAPKIVEANSSGMLVHEPGLQNPSQAYMLSQLTYPEFPVPLGVFRRVARPTYEELAHGQVDEAIHRAGGPGDLGQLIKGKSSWTVT